MSVVNGGDKGVVYLVGAGPGDPGLLTLRAVEVLRSVDVVVYDRLVGPQVLEMTESLERIYVGKGKDSHAVDQDSINELLVKLALQGRRVCRLKGGDPFVFGRGGEEAARLAEAGVDFEVVPGITSAIAGPAYAGIPVTDRRAASSFACVTAHQRADGPTRSIDWAALVRGCDTIVVLMGSSRIDAVVADLVDAGLASSHPVAVIESATLPGQRTVEGTLGDIAARAADAKIGSPALIVVGNVVPLSGKIEWLSKRRLHGVTVMVTRDEGANGTLSGILRSHGAAVVGAPTLRIQPLEDESVLDASISRIGEYDWVVFSSISAVSYVFKALKRNRLDARALAPCRVSAIGPGTAAALEERGITPDLIPDRFVSESLGDALVSELRPGSSILIFGALGGRTELADTLRSAGHKAALVPAYRNIPVKLEPVHLAALEAGEVDWVAFTSSSSVKRLLDAAGGAKGLPPGTRIACIGQTTAATAESLGLTVTIVAEEHTLDGLASSITKEAGPVPVS